MRKKYNEFEWEEIIKIKEKFEQLINYNEFKGGNKNTTNKYADEL